VKQINWIAIIYEMTGIYLNWSLNT